MNIFLSASIPLPDRDRQFFDTADIIAIREAIKSLVEVILPLGSITCGGHPAITPLLSLFVREAGLHKEKVTIFQSSLFSGKMPPELSDFLDVRIISAVGKNRELSLTEMRTEMVKSRDFSAIVIIGGMEGIYEELDLFKMYNRNAKILPISSTGAAALDIYNRGDFSNKLESRTYSSLFRRELKTI